MTAKTKKSPEYAIQIDEMQRLSLRAASWLANTPSSTLRDHSHTCAPNADGTFDARAVARWMATRPASVKMDEDDTEMLIRLSEAVALDLVLVGTSVRKVMTEFIHKYGSNAASIFLQQLMDELQYQEGDLPDAASEDESDEYGRLSAQLAMETICESCGKKRRGFQWVKSKKARPGRYWRGVCPDCEYGG